MSRVCVMGDVIDIVPRKKSQAAGEVLVMTKQGTDTAFAADPRQYALGTVADCTGVPHCLGINRWQYLLRTKAGGHV